MKLNRKVRAKVVNIAGRLAMRERADLFDLMAVYHEAEAAMLRALAKALRDDGGNRPPRPAA